MAQPGQAAVLLHHRCGPGCFTGGAPPRRSPASPKETAVSMGMPPTGSRHWLEASPSVQEGLEPGVPGVILGARHCGPSRRGPECSGHAAARPFCSQKLGAGLQVALSRAWRRPRAEGTLGNPPSSERSPVCPQTMLTAISMSAIATNGVVPGRGAAGSRAWRGGAAWVDGAAWPLPVTFALHPR